MTTKKQPPKFNSTRGGYRENAGRKSGWNHRDTCTIRIPKTFACELVELARRLDNGEKIDIDTESKQTGEELVTQSKQVWTDSDQEQCRQSEKQELIGIDTKSKQTDNDFVTQSLRNSDLSLTQPTFPLENQELTDIDTESILPETDFVTKSDLDVIETSQISYLSVQGLQEALTYAKTIIKAKKSARESVARLLSKLYSAQVSPDDLS